MGMVLDGLVHHDDLKECHVPTLEKAREEWYTGNGHAVPDANEADDDEEYDLTVGEEAAFGAVEGRAVIKLTSSWKPARGNSKFIAKEKVERVGPRARLQGENVGPTRYEDEEPLV